MKNTLALAGALAAASCVSIDLDNNEKTTATTAAIVEFDPSKSIVPFPNNLLIDRNTGKVNLPDPRLPPPCEESPASKLLRTLVLNALDGFGTFKSAQRITLTEAVDMASVAGNIVMYPRLEGARELPVAEAMMKAVPLVAIPGTSERIAADCAKTDVPSLTLVPARPLTARTTYVVAVLKGLKSASGADFGASSTWGLVRQKESPVTVEGGEIISERTPLNPNKPEDKTTLLGLDLLWKAHARGLAHVEAITTKPRADILLAWEFTTQTTTAPLDPAVAGTPAAGLPQAPISGMTTIAAGATPVDDHMNAMLQSLGAPASLCTTFQCGARVSSVLNGTVTAPRFQSSGTNPLAGGNPIPGPWSSPLSPLQFGSEALQVRVFVPTGTRPAAGWPTVVFGHGLGGNRVQLYLIASQLAGRGIASVAVDFVAHGTRAVRNSNTAALGCADAAGPPARPNPSQDPQCFAPFLSTNLAVTRDNVRQTVLDLQTLVQSLKRCNSDTACAVDGNVLRVDPAKIAYLGISLGAIVGATTVAVTPDFRTAVLNVGGAGWVDVFEQTGTAAIRCSVVNGLIDAGIVMGTKAPPPFTDMNATCNKANDPTMPNDHWTEQPGYRTFANIARWILDSADGANFAARLGPPTRRVLIQKVMGDTVVPNSTTDALAALSGHTMPALADPAASSTPTPSAAILAPTPVNKWVQYNNIAGPPGNTFSHGSLLSGPATAEGQLGTARMQTDAITYLLLNLPVP